MSPAELEELGSRITCAEAIDFMLAYLDNSMPELQHEIFAAHLAICDDCRNYLVSYESTIRLMRPSSDARLTKEVFPPIPDDLINAILKALPARVDC